MVGGISTLALSEIVVNFTVATVAYLVCILITENGGYRANKFAAMLSSTLILGVVVVTVLGVYGHYLDDVTDKIDRIAVSVAEFPEKIADCMNSTAVENLFNHYGIQKTAGIAGTIMRAFEGLIIGLVVVFTTIPVGLFWMASIPWFNIRERLFWFGFYWSLALIIVCMVVALFYDVVVDAQHVMRTTGGITGQARAGCSSTWDELVAYSIVDSPTCTATVEREMCVVHNAIRNFTHDRMEGFYASSASTAFLPPLLTIMLGLVVFFTWKSNSRKSSMRNSYEMQPMSRTNKKVSFMSDNDDKNSVW